MDNQLRYKSVEIIPNEKLTNIPYFFKDTMEYNHEKLIELWCIENGKELMSNSDLIMDGYVTIHTVANSKDSCEIICVYVPDVISDAQYKFLLSQRERFLKYNLLGFQIEVSGYEPINDENSPIEILDYFYEIVQDCVEERGLK